MTGASHPDRLTVKLGEKQWAAIDPARCHYFTTSAEPAVQDSRGCLLRAAGTSPQHSALETGPWHRDCPQ